MQDTAILAEQLTVNDYAFTQQKGTVQTIAASGTINVNYGAVRVTATAARAAVILAAPTDTTRCHLLCVIHEGAAANTLTFDVAGTSNVAGGAATSLAGLSAHLFVWDTVTLLWYQVGTLVN